MKKFKQRIAVALAIVMVAGCSMTAFAAEENQGTVTGSGELEGTVSTDVWNVQLPTKVVGDTTYDFILDPEGLIEETEAARYSGATFTGDTGMFFANVSGGDVSGGDVSGGDVSYSPTSDAKTIINKSSYAVDVTVTATVKAAVDSEHAVTLSEDNTFANDKTTSIYLALTDGTNTGVVKTSTKVATISSTIGAAPDGSYVYAYENDEYTYKLKADLSDDIFEDYSFQLTGACNKAADWADFEDADPQVEIVYSVAKHADVTDDYKIIMANGAASYTFVNAPDTNAAGITAMTINGTARMGAVDGGNITYANGVLSFNEFATSALLTVGAEVVATINGENFTFSVVTQ